MSGTSLDGVDAAMVEDRWRNRSPPSAETAYRPYSGRTATIRAALGRWPGDPGVAASRGGRTAHAALLAAFPGPRFMGFHGQTLAHDPAGRGTHQAATARSGRSVLGTARRLGFPLVRCAMGGQGAPLAPFFHFACAKWIGSTVPLVFLNLGGVGNLTWVDPTAPAPKPRCAVWPSTPARPTPRSTT
jgi:anhydro-N-acetylmuramic acid kinase